LNSTVLLLGILGLLLVFAIIVVIAGSITRPLRALSRATENIAMGKLDLDLPEVVSRDEVGKLTESFQSMAGSLRKHIAELTETTAAKERIESELRIAHEIQMGILPKTFPPFPDRNEFDISAKLVPAREVGGDLYDFFFMDRDNLCFTIGDVSGKGVPSALFMAVTRTLIKVKATQGLTPETVLERVNEDLSLDNPTSMFVTLFLAILNVRTGVVDYCNGGHNPPFLVRASGNLAPLETTQGLALGVLSGFSYRSRRIVLKRGDTLFLYTDGVTEAMSPSGEMFSESRLKDELAVLRDQDVEAMGKAVLERISRFTQSMPQADDIAMLILRYYGP
jgi:sigma-B regulation protein RsbU (phosphoserine phosphatase)